MAAGTDLAVVSLLAQLTVTTKAVRCAVQCYCQPAIRVAWMDSA